MIMCDSVVPTRRAVKIPTTAVFLLMENMLLLMLGGFEGSVVVDPRGRK